MGSYTKTLWMALPLLAGCAAMPQLSSQGAGTHSGGKANLKLTAVSLTTKKHASASYELTLDGGRFYYSFDYLHKPVADFGVSEETRIKLEKEISIYIINDRKLMPAPGNSLSGYAREIQSCLDTMLSNNGMTSKTNGYLYRYLYKFGAAYVTAKNLYPDGRCIDAADRPTGHGVADYKGAYPAEWYTQANHGGVCKDYANFYVKLIQTAGKEIQRQGSPLGFRAYFQICHFRPLADFDANHYDPEHNPGQHALAWVGIPVSNSSGIVVYDYQPQDVTLTWGSSRLNDINPKTFALQPEASAKDKQSPITPLEIELFTAKYCTINDPYTYEGTPQNLMYDVARNKAYQDNMRDPYHYPIKWLKEPLTSRERVDYLNYLKGVDEQYHQVCTAVER